MMVPILWTLIPLERLNIICINCSIFNEIKHKLSSTTKRHAVLSQLLSYPSSYPLPIQYITKIKLKLKNKLYSEFHFYATHSFRLGLPNNSFTSQWNYNMIQVDRKQTNKQKQQNSLTWLQEFYHLCWALKSNEKIHHIF